MPIDNDAQIIPRALILGSTGRLGSFLVKSNFLGSEYEILAGDYLNTVYINRRYDL